MKEKSKILKNGAETVKPNQELCDEEICKPQHEDNSEVSRQTDDDGDSQANKQSFLLMKKWLTEYIEEPDKYDFLYDLNPKFFESNYFFFNFLSEIKRLEPIKNDIDFQRMNTLNYSVKDMIILNNCEELIDLNKILKGINLKINYSFFYPSNFNHKDPKLHKSQKDVEEIIFRKIKKNFSILFKLINQPLVKNTDDETKHEVNNQQLSFALNLNSFFCFINEFCYFYFEKVDITISNDGQRGASNNKIFLPKKRFNSFNNLNLVEVLHFGNKTIKKIQKYKELKKNIFDEEIEKSNYGDYSWLEKLKLFCYSIKCQFIEADDEDKDNAKKESSSKKTSSKKNEKDSNESNKNDNALSISQKIEYLLKKLNNYNTYDFLYELVELEKYIFSFYNKVVELLKKAKISLKDFLINDKVDKNFKSEIIFFLKNYQFSTTKFQENKANDSDSDSCSSDDSNEDYNFFDKIILLFDVLYEIVINSQIFKDVINEKYAVRTELLAMINTILKKHENKTNDLDLDNLQDESTSNEKDSISGRNFIQKLYDLSDNLSIYDPKIYSDKDYIISVIINF